MDRNWRTDAPSKGARSDSPLKDEFAVGEHETVRPAELGYRCDHCGRSVVLLRELDGQPCTAETTAGGESNA